MAIRSFAGREPAVHRRAFVHEAAEVIGRVRLGAEASLWPGAVARADVGGIEIGARSNVQDNAVIHCREKFPSRIGRGVTIGHGAIVHGARVGDLCLIGMGAIVMEAVIGRECLIGAGALVRAGQRIPAGSLVLGAPAKVVRPLTAAERRSLKESADSYVALMEKHRRASRRVAGAAA